MHPYTSVIIPAAGSGSRMKAGMNKQFLELAGKPIIAHTLLAFDRCPYVDEVVIVAKSEEIPGFTALVSKLDLAKPVRYAMGGATRQASVHNGIRICSPNAAYVAIHDGARPFLTAGELERIFEEGYALKSIVAAVPTKDTIKRVDEHGVVIETLDRKELWNIQTPQIFEKDLIRSAYDQAETQGFTGTDDASLMEWMGEAVHVVMGSYNNLKITTPEDLAIGEILLKDRQ